MSLETIDRSWRPCKEISEKLKGPQYGYSQEQVNDLGWKFIERYCNKQLQEASETFFKFVTSSGVGHNMPKPDTSNNEKQAEERKNNFANKSENSAERAAEIKRGIKYKVGEDQLRQNLAMIQARFGWTAEQSQEWWDRESKKDSYRPDRPKQND